MKHIFTKIITGVRGYTFGEKNLTKFSGLDSLCLGWVYYTNNICEIIYLLYKMHQNLKQYEKIILKACD